MASRSPPIASTIQQQLFIPGLHCQAVKMAHQLGISLQALSMLLFTLVSLSPTREEGSKLAERSITEMNKSCCLSDFAYSGKMDPRLEVAFQQAVRWAMHLDTHPERLRETKQMKGLKHMVEYLDLLHLVHSTTRDGATRCLCRVLAAARLTATQQSTFHEALISKGPKRFRQDNMSYLRALWLGEAFQLGNLFNSSSYRDQVEKMLPQLYAHLPSRGVDQQMGFAMLLEQLGLRNSTAAMQALVPQTTIVTRKPATWFYAANHRAYDLSHEIFALTLRGTVPVMYLNRDDISYASQLLMEMYDHYENEGMLDIQCELLINMAQLDSNRFKQTLLAGRKALSQQQNADGSFGQYAHLQHLQAPNYDIQVGGNLHTTLVCLWALAATTVVE
eukprot:m.11031 g.11031  ORF g.11031 m.11031 type:complete len:390 (-) comp9741_c0_seq3:818-1987(-)